MPTYGWTGNALTDGTALTSGNVNTAGNGDAVVYQALVGGATRVVRHETNGDGLEISGTTTGDQARLDTATVVGGASCMSIQGIYRAPTAPSGGSNYIFLGRNANATPASSGNVQHTTGNTLQFRTAADVVATSSVSGSATTATTPTLTANNYYQIDLALLVGTTTSNGRILGRVIALNEANWVSTGVNEFWFDSGYTLTTTTDNTNLFRTGKVLTTGSVGTFRLLNMKWRDVTSPNTSLTKSSAITNFVQVVGPTISSTGTGAYYVIYAVGTPAAGGTLSYSITQTGGTTTAATSITSGVYRVVQDTGGALTYDVTVTESPSGGSTTSTYTVPAATTLTPGQFRVRRQVSGVLV